MIDQSHQLSVNLLGKTYTFECQPKEQQQLLAAADYINQWVESNIQIQNEKTNNENLYAMVALNMANELLNLRENNDKANLISQRIKQALDNSRSNISRIGIDL